jgi:hypothetical protein
MSELDNVLRENKEWYAEFKEMPFGERACDSGCGKPPIEWFGNTSCATCGEPKCVAIQQQEYDSYKSSEDDQ